MKIYTTAAYLPEDHQMNNPECTCTACQPEGYYRVSPESAWEPLPESVIVDHKQGCQCADCQHDNEILNRKRS